MTIRRPATKNSSREAEATRLAEIIHALGDYAHVLVRSNRGHLCVYASDDEDAVARVTPLAQGQYGLSFHSHTGRWEPMPVSGDLDHVARELVNMLGMYLTGHDFSNGNSGSGY